MNAATKFDTTVFVTADDTASGARVVWDGQAYVVEGIETGHQIARTASAEAAAAHVAAYLISYGTDADGDWSATVAQGREILANLGAEAGTLACALGQ